MDLLLSVDLLIRTAIIDLFFEKCVGLEKGRLVRR